MVEHVSQWLGAYLDDELRGLERERVKTHLAECDTCQAELKSLQNLSILLRETPLRVDFTPAERFTAQVALRLPRRRPAP